MKTTIKFIMLLALSVTTLTSCFIEDVLVETTEPSAANEDGANLASFAVASKTLGAIANGDEYVFDLKMELKGPTSKELTGDVTLTVGVDPSSSAIEGYHFKLATTTMTLSKSNNYLGFFPITMLSEGIVAPLAVAPVVKLVVTDASGTGNVLNNGKPIAITLNYLCFSNLSGTYDAEMVYTAYDGSTSNINYTDVITETGVGEYRTSRVGHWTAAALGYTPGFTFYDVCNEITIPGQNLVDAYGNWVDDLGVRGSVNPDTGVITVRYSICYPQGTDNCRYYDTKYTPKN